MRANCITLLRIWLKKLCLICESFCSDLGDLAFFFVKKEGTKIEKEISAESKQKPKIEKHRRNCQSKRTRKESYGQGREWEDAEIFPLFIHEKAHGRNSWEHSNTQSHSPHFAVHFGGYCMCKKGWMRRAGLLPHNPSTFQCTFTKRWGIYEYSQVIVLL